MRKKISPVNSITNTISTDGRNTWNTCNLQASIGCISLLNSVRVVILTGLLSTLVFLALIILFFRPAILATTIPVAVISATIFATLQQKHYYLWPIIGISWFHVFLAIYFELLFMYFFIFKPNYIIMVLNWAFDTLYTKKTTSYYVQCTAITALTIAFGLFNLWQLSVSMNFKALLRRQEELNRSDPPSQIISIVIERDNEQSTKY